VPIKYLAITAKATSWQRNIFFLEVMA